ncbi:MAG: aldehyde dehydrogenase family protein [Verrucomicrobia bacterium]|nr:aldehyde dehydrogenase family protein [Verrucomicrobiota bacterium]
MSLELEAMYQRARAAFQQVEFWPQERVDEMVAAAGWEWQKEDNRRAMARLAVEESGIGVYEDKFHKIFSKTIGTLRDQAGARTCGLVREEPEKGLAYFAKPIGVIANVVPCTNPESTVCCLGLSTLKTRNAMIVSPHPRTPGSTALAVELGRKALRKVGAPEDLLQCIGEPSHENTRALMARCDFAIATGGAALVRVVYEAGKPAQSVGAGNVVSIVDSTVDLKSTAAKIVKSKTANNSASCSSENAIAIEESVYGPMMEALRREGCHLLNEAERERLRNYYWPDGRTLNREVVAKPAAFIAERAGIAIPAGTRVILVLGIKPGREDRFSGEKISPVMTVWKWTDFGEMVDRVCAILRFSGEGHSVSIHSLREERRHELALKAKVGRIVCNMGHTAANSGGWGSGMPTTDSLGCGTWAGNMTSENINWRHFLNYTIMTTPIPERIPTEEEIFGAYLKKWGRE